jgi:hypothetical protein
MKKPSEDGSQSPPEVTLPEVTDSASSVHTSLVLDLHKRSTGADSENSTSKDLEDPGSHAPESSQFANAPAVAVKEGIVVSKRITAIFTLASELLRESMELEGVLFLDACRCSSAV